MDDRARERERQPAEEFLLDLLFQAKSEREMNLLGVCPRISLRCAEFS